MKHILCILLATLLLLCTGCTNSVNSPKEAPDNPSAATAPDPADSPKETPNSLPAATQDDTEPVPQQAEKFYDYFAKIGHMSMLFDHEAGTIGFSDSEMAAYTIAHAIAQNPDYDFDKGISKEEFDKITQKYFGKIVSNYKNSKTTVLETGNIVSTGWGPTAFYFVLKDLQKAEDTGSQTAIFYKIPFSMQAEFADPSAQVTSEEQKSKHLQGDFSGMKEAALVEMQFEELTDENGEMYLRYLSINETGSAQPPYTVG